MTTNPNSTANTASAPKKRGRPRKNPEVQLQAADVKNAVQSLREFESVFEADPTPIKAVPLEDNSYEELFQKAKNIYRIPVTSDYTKMDIINAIRKKISGGRSGDHALSEDHFGENVIPPGYAKIELFKDPAPKARNAPHYFMVNGYRCTVPKGVPVLVPIKVYEVLKNAVESRRVEDTSITARNSDSARFKEILVHRLPHQLHGLTPGPDPKPVMEKVKERTFAPRRKFNNLFGFWPTSNELKQAIKDGLITIGA